MLELGESTCTCFKQKLKRELELPAYLYAAIAVIWVLQASNSAAQYFYNQYVSSLFCGHPFFYCIAELGLENLQPFQITMSFKARLKTHFSTVAILMVVWHFHTHSEGTYADTVRKQDIALFTVATTSLKL